ncbi:MAG: hypothetical protein L0Z50_42685 [Verrucomicrobiales bacterium]|nr:hypothetical protein [Verrucomicrobiales bacterium]
MKPKLVLLALLSTLLLTGCNQALVLKAPLEPDEKVSKNDVVFVDGTAAGHVKKVVVEGGQRTAFLAITGDSVVKQKMRVGVARVREDGKISLRSGAVEEQSPSLTSGWVIPVMSKAGFAVRKFSSSKIVTILFTGLAVLVVVLLLFRRLTRSWLLLLTLVLSASSAWAALPWASVAVTKAYSLLPQVQPHAGAQQGLSRLIHNPPDAQVVGYAAVFITAFVILSIIMRCALNRLESRGQS